MARLHIVSQSPHESGALISCLKFASAGDALLLTENGVFAALADDRSSLLPTDSETNGIALYVLTEDLAARGLSGTTLRDGINPVDRGGFVDLTVNMTTVHSWF